ncbi:hypothetical protein [Mariniphaga sp.]|uniref:hypothetical protein n=1 Tax=Mariniphaga sp. TaxID=1954475 RepID=UPI0035687E11
MNKTLGITGYAILIASAAFLDIPFLGLLAMVTFLVGIILLLIFYLKLIDGKNRYKFFFSFLTIFGVLVMCGVLGYSAVEFNEYLVAADRGQQLTYSPLVRIIQIVGVILVGSISIFVSVKYCSKLNRESFYLVWLPTLLIIPVTIILIKILQIIGAPLSA